MCACSTTPCGEQFPDGETSQQTVVKEGKGVERKDGVMLDKNKEEGPATWQERLNRLKKLALKLLSDGQKLYTKIQRDPFKCQVVKGTVYFTLGLKLYRDLARHLAPKPCGSQL